MTTTRKILTELVELWTKQNKKYVSDQMVIGKKVITYQISIKDLKKWLYVIFVDWK